MKFGYYFAITTLKLKNRLFCYRFIFDFEATFRVVDSLRDSDEVPILVCDCDAAIVESFASIDLDSLGGKGITFEGCCQKADVGLY